MQGCSYFTYALTRMSLSFILRGKDRTATMGCSCEFSNENSYFKYALTRMSLPLRCRGKDRTATMGCSCEFSDENSYFTYALTRMALPLRCRGKDRRAFSPLERRSLRLSEADGAAAEARIAWFCAVKRSKSRPYYKKIEFLSVDCLNLSKIPVCLKR